MGHNAPGCGCSLKLKGPLAELSNYRILDTDSKVDFAEAIASQGGDDVRHVALDNAVTRAQSDPRMSHLEFRLFRHIAKRCHGAWRYYAESHEALAHFCGLRGSSNLSRSIKHLVELGYLRKLTVTHFRYSKHFKNTLLAVVCCEADRNGTVDQHLRDEARARKVSDDLGALDAESDTSTDRHDDGREPAADRHGDGGPTVIVMVGDRHGDASRVQTSVPKKSSREAGPNPQGGGAMPSLSGTAGITAPGGKTGCKGEEPSPSSVAPSHQSTDNSFRLWLCNYEGSKSDGLTPAMIGAIERLLAIAEQLDEVTSSGQLMALWDRAFPHTVEDPPLGRIWQLYQNHRHASGAVEPTGLLNGALVAFNNLVPKFAKLLGQYGNVDTARGIMVAELNKAGRDRSMKGAAEGRLAIAIEDMITKRAAGKLHGDPARRLYAFMRQVDPAKADERAAQMHDTLPEGVGRTPKRQPTFF